jgi:hypothetical protein
VHKTAQIVAKFQPVYQYIFTRNGPYSAINISEGAYKNCSYLFLEGCLLTKCILCFSTIIVFEFHQYGVSHADDFNYEFDFTSDKCSQFTMEDFAVADMLTTLWTNFAKTGDFSAASEVAKVSVNNRQVCQLILRVPFQDSNSINVELLKDLMVILILAPHCKWSYRRSAARREVKFHS